MIEGCRVGTNGPSIPMLLIVDDALFFVKDSSKQIQNL